MLRMLGSPRRFCDGVTRRETLRVGALSASGGMSALSGLSLPGMLDAEARAAAQGAPPGKAKSVIMLYLLGGAPHQDMYDLKPDAPAEIRGEFKPIDTNVPGIRISEQLPLSAKWMHRSAILRTVNHKAGCHNTLPSYTGFEQFLPDIVNAKDTYPPSMGSVCEFLKPSGQIDPAYVYMPCYLGWGQSIFRPGPYAGFLGKRYDPLYTECSPFVDKPPDTPYNSQPLRGEPRIPSGVLSEGLTIDRMLARRGLLEQLDDEYRRVEDVGHLGSYNRQQARAWSILTGSPVRKAFDLDEEDPRLRDRYTRTLFGQSALVARRLVEAGVRFVNVTWDCYWERLQLQFECWDTHANNFPVLRNYNLPYLDQTFSALMEDLENRGLLDETLVVVNTDFGRTPRINGNAGRDHWTFNYSVLLAGAGIRGGTVHGVSDAQAAYPKEFPVSTGDVCATIYRCLGIDPEMPVHDQVGRPVKIAHGGEPIGAVLA